MQSNFTAAETLKKNNATIEFVLNELSEYNLFKDCHSKVNK